MKFTLRESIFDDEFNMDDNFELSDHDPDNVPGGPSTGVDNGAASELIALIEDEWEAITGYNNAIATLRVYGEKYSDAIRVLEEINNEENIHVGQLEEVLKTISPNAASIQHGSVEAKSQLGFVNGRLPVQSWSDSTPNNSAQTDINNTCTLTDVDDDF